MNDCFKFFMDPEKEKLNLKLFTEEIQKEVKGVRITTTQIRNFYSEIKNIERKLTLGENWETVKPFVKLLKPKILYKANSNKKYKEFKDFLNKGIDSIDDEKDFKAFSKLFEAFIGYFSEEIANQRKNYGGSRK